MEQMSFYIAHLIYEATWSMLPWNRNQDGRLSVRLTRIGNASRRQHVTKAERIYDETCIRNMKIIPPFGSGSYHYMKSTIGCQNP